MTVSQIEHAQLPTSDHLYPTVCPICYGNSLKLLHSFTAKQAAEMFLPTYRDPQRHAKLTRNIEGSWKRSECDVVQCDNCRFAFPIPYVAGDKDFYELAYGVPSYPRHRWEYGRALEFLKSFVSSDSARLLELGAGAGQFIKALLRIRKFNADQIVATDYSSHSVEQLRKLRIDARRDSVFELAACSRNRASFDAVCAFQSIEHMANVTEVVLTLKGMLKPNGLAILSVPHGVAIEFSERHLRCFDMPPNHVGRWYRETFVALAASTGMKLVAHEVEPLRPLRLLKDVTELAIRGRSASNPRSLAGRVQAIQNRPLRRMLSAAVGSMVLVPLLPAAFRLGSGYSQLAVFQVPAATST
jgi:2-polyprenyl-3-methyl-5-hydroxy-6-metoxy-1,4-benzoquinol methylase